MLGDRDGPQLDLRVAPKVPIARLMFLLGYAQSTTNWRYGPVELPESADLPSAIAEALIRLTYRAFAQGLLQGHRGVEVPRRPRRRCAAEPDGAPVRRVGLLRPGAPLPRWRPDRLNLRYQPALRLAKLVLTGTSFDLGRRAVPAVRFAVNMATVFKRLVEQALGRPLETVAGGRVSGQGTDWSIDSAGRIPLRPDLVWYPPGSQRAGLVIDAKYKAEQPSGFPNADVYQLLAYCSALELAHGHLVYAEGNEVQREHFLPGTGPGRRGVTIHVHTLDLAAEPAALLGQVDALAAGMVGDAA